MDRFSVEIHTIKGGKATTIIGSWPMRLGDPANDKTDSGLNEDIGWHITVSFMEGADEVHIKRVLNG